MYFLTDIDPATGEPFTSDLETSCGSGTVNQTASNTVIIIAEGSSPDDISTRLPDVMLGIYDVAFTDENGLSTNTSQINTCTDNTVVHITQNDNATSTTTNIAYSGNGVLYCVKTWTWESVTYVYTYNNDTNVDQSTTYRFTCWVVAASTGSSLVHVSVAPEVCMEGQTPTTAPTGVQSLILKPTVNADDSSSTSKTWIIIVIVICCVLVITVIVVIVIYCVWKRKQKRRRQIQTDEKTVAIKEPEIPKPAATIILNKTRPKSSNDLTAELVKQEKLKKKAGKKKETRSIAVQASIWTAPIKRTVTALETDVKLKRTTSNTTIKFIPYVKRPVQTKQTLNTSFEGATPITRHHTTLEKTSVQTVQPMVRSKTNIVQRSTLKQKQKSFTRKSFKENKKRTLITERLSELNSRPADMFSYEFEKHFPFPMEGNPNEFHNTLETEVPDETKNQYTPTSNNKELDVETETSKQEQPTMVKNNGQLTETNVGTNKTDKLRNSAKSRPSTSEGILGVRHQHGGSVRKTNSERMNRSKTILKFSYNSPYAMSNTQKVYMSMKSAWVREQLTKNEENKKHFEEMKKLENQRAFDQWIKNKRNSIHNVRSKFTKRRNLSNANSTNSKQNVSKVDDSEGSAQ